MEVIPVLDVWGGRAVHARGGDRQAYRPVRSVLAEGSNPLALAQAYRDRLRARSCYLADLDAIAGAAPNLELARSIAREGLRLWVDAGIRESDVARSVLAAGAERAVVGTETLPGLRHLAAIAAHVDPAALVLSLDLWEGCVVLGSERTRIPPLDLAEHAYRAGFRTFILLELARVGNLGGPSTELLRLVRARFPTVLIAVGGGVRDRHDLERLAEDGCQVALVATGLHTGKITAQEIRQLAE